MIEIGIFILSGFIFFKYAKEHSLVAWLWAFVPVAAYYTGMLVFAFLVKAFAPQLMNERSLLTAIALFFEAIFIGLAYLLMMKVAKNKAKELNESKETILDK